MNYNNPIPKRTAAFISLSCRVLFCLFSFLYLLCIQNELLAEAHYVYSGGQTGYSALWGATVITMLLLLIQMTVEYFVRFSGRWYALSFFPSFLVLSMFCCLNPDVFENFSFGAWAWWGPILIILYAGFIYISSYFPDNSIVEQDYHSGRYLWPNYLILLVMICISASFRKVSDVQMYEYKTERLLVDDNYDEAWQVGIESLETSPRLNQLRCYALAQKYQLGEHLFDYPQLYGLRGLIDIDDTCSLYRFGSRQICAALGMMPDSIMDGVLHQVPLTDMEYIEYVFQSDTTHENNIVTENNMNPLRDNPTIHQKLVREYYLCSKLLNRDIKDFSEALKRYYDITNHARISTLPKAYREALILEASMIGEDSLSQFCDTAMLSLYRGYLDLRHEYGSDSLTVERRNYTRRQFGNTLWWFLDNEEAIKETVDE